MKLPPGRTASAIFVVAICLLTACSRRPPGVSAPINPDGTSTSSFVGSNANSEETQQGIRSGQTAALGALTPTPSPEDRLALARAMLERGRAFQSDGDRDLAIGEMKGVPALVPGTPEAGEALFRLGQCFVARQRFEEAEQALRGFLLVYPNDDRTGTARFYLAAALRGLGRGEEAVESYEVYVAAEPATRSYAEFAIGETYLTMGRYDLAGERFIRVIQDEVTSLRRSAMENLAKSYSQREQYSEAARWYEAALEEAGGASDEASLRFLLGSAYAKAGNLAAANTQFDTVVRRFPLNSDSAKALYALLEMGEEVSAYFQGRVSFFQWDLKEAASLLNAYLLANAAGEYAPLAHYYLGRTYWRQDDEDRALKEFSKVADGFPRSDVAPESHWLRGRILEEQGRLEAAAAEYQRLAKDYPRGEYWAEALFRRGLIAYKMGDLQGAAELWLSNLKDDSFSLTLPSEARPKLLLWAGKALSTLGRNEEARQLWRRAAELEPEDYYGLRAEEMLRGAAVPGRSSGGQDRLPSPVTETMKSDLAQWLSALPAPATAGSGLSLERDQGLQRARMLLRIGLREEGAAELRAVIDRFSRQPKPLYELAVLAQEERLYHLAISAGWLLQRLSSDFNLAGLPTLVQRLLYPAPYAGLVLGRGGEEGLDPLFIFALMRQESLFNRDAHSPAGASGLTQVMPSTGEEIAKKIGKDAFRPADLLQPSVSVTFGVWYLARQLETFKGNLFFALAAYNAGAGNVWDWNRGDLGYDTDLFVEEILFNETRAYVKKVYSNYRLYQRLYPE